MMLRLVLTSALVLVFSFGFGQLKKFYTLQESHGYDTISFSLEATTGNCYLKASDEKGPLSIYGNPDLEKINPSFKSKVVNGTCQVALDLEEFRSSSLSDGLILAVLHAEETQNNFWKVLLDREKIYDLDLNYGFGDADVDLSDISVSKLKVRSGSADITVNYNDGEPNRIEMDTFWVKADMGRIETKNLELARARHVIANIGFGKASLDFSNSSTQKCNIDASVGAGSLDVFLPSNDVPIIIYMKESPLCGMRMAKGFEQVEPNVFVNMSYKADANNLLTFYVDVALGNVNFH
ncbi:MAG: hypothetical protein ACI8WP_000018 [Flavobacteriaceae bacterium]|jgi:hypothetical protein